MNDFFVGLSCFTTILFFLALIGILVWVRSRLRTLQMRVDSLTHQVDLITRGPHPVISPIPAAEVDASMIAPMVSPTSTTETAPSIQLPAAPELEPAFIEEEESSTAAVEMPAPKAPAPPNPLIAWFTRMNIMVQIGVIVLFFGVGFLVKYAADQGWLSIELRLTGAALLGVALAGVGWRVRHKARGYGLALIGGGIGIVYLTTFGAYRIYGLLPPTLAFAIFVGLGVLYAIMALLNDAQILAFLALLGGLLAPILASSDGGSHVMLFSYYLVVNAGILAIAWFKSWRTLNIASFGLTLLAGIGWGASEYTLALFATTEPFLVIFFLFYLTLSVLYARRAAIAEEGRTTITDVILLFANPLAAFVLQYALVEGFDGGATHWMAQSALALAFVYAGLALWFTRGLGVAGLVVEGFIFLATFFLAISFPLLYDERITAAIWAIQGAALHWLGGRRRQGWAHLWGLVIRLGATFAFFVDIAKFGAENDLTQLPLFTNHIYVGAVILSLSALLAAYLARAEQGERPGVYTLLSTGLLIWGLFWWFSSGMGEIAVHVRNTRYILSSEIAFVALSCVAAELVGAWLGWTALRLTFGLLLPGVSALALVQLAEGEPIWAGGGWYAWPLAILAHGFMLWRIPGWPWGERRWHASYHAGGVWLVAFLLTRLAYAFALMRTPVATWHALAWLLAPALVLWLVGPLNQRMPWPISTYPRRYAILGGLPLALFLVVTALGASFTLPGDSTPFSYLPVLNPLTLALILVFALLWGWLRKIGREMASDQKEIVWLGKLALGVIAFVVLNAGLARDIHHLTGVPFAWDALFDSEVLQTTYAIVWSVISLVLMFWANRRGQTQTGWSPVWFFGAAVLALTVLKLFVVDLANTGAIARIISFMGVGLLIIVIAYFAPLPPREERMTE